MSKRLVDIDDALLERARAAAGTATIKATVAAGLSRLADPALVLKHLRRLRGPATLDRERLTEARNSRIKLNG